MSDKTQQPPRPRPRPTSAVPTSAKATAPSAAAPVTAIPDPRTDLGGATGAYLKSVAERPYSKLAFANPYNLTLLAGGLSAAALTLNPLLALTTCALELWGMLHAPDSKTLRRLVWDPRLEKQAAAAMAAERGARLALLGAADRKRVDAIFQRCLDIRRLAAQNPSFTGELLRNELVKTDRLVDAFVDMALACTRYESYLEQVDPRQLDQDRRRYEEAVRAGKPGDQQTAIANKNLELIKKRADKLDEIRRSAVVARGQLDLIENSFQLIADQIVTMQSPQELAGPLDELLDGVEAIRETTRETEDLLGSAGRSP